MPFRGLLMTLTAANVGRESRLREVFSYVVAARRDLTPTNDNVMAAAVFQRLSTLNLP
jgi:hypothetical protein